MNAIPEKTADKLKSIRVDGLKKVYRSGFLNKKSVLAVENLSFEIEEGEIYGFLGPNGAGKTTTLLCLLSLIPFDDGRISIMGKKLTINSPLFLSIGYVPEEPALYEYLTGEEYLAYSARLKEIKRDEIPKVVEKCLGKLELLESRKRLIRNYSKGMKQRLQISEAIINNPKLLFLDEPTRGLDPIGVKVVRNLFEELAADGTTIFLNSHILSEVELICTRVGILNKGRMVWDGSPKNLSNENAGHKIIFKIPPENFIEEDFKSIGGEDNVYEARSSDSKDLFEIIEKIKAKNGEIVEVSPVKRLEDYFIEKIGNDHE